MNTAESCKYTEKIKKEVEASKIVLRWMNDAGMFKDARPIGPDVQYKSSSIAAIPFVKELVVPTENYKPKSDPKAFQYCKDGMGMSGLNLFAKGKNDPRQPRFDSMPKELGNREFYGKPDATASFCRKNGAFVAQHVEDPYVDSILEMLERDGISTNEFCGSGK